MDFIQQWIMPGISFLAAVGFGCWVSRTGKPYPGLLFNLHKLIALGAALLTGIRIFKLEPFSTFPRQVILWIILVGLGAIAMFATGAIMSIQDQVKRAPHFVHQIAAVIIAGAMVFGLYVLYQ